MVMLLVNGTAGVVGYAPHGRHAVSRRRYHISKHYRADQYAKPQVIASSIDHIGAGLTWISKADIVKTRGHKIAMYLSKAM